MVMIKNYKKKRIKNLVVKMISYRIYMSLYVLGDPQPEGINSVSFVRSQ